jgi:HAD superfamily phosphatase (TIGR01668 family)
MLKPDIKVGTVSEITRQLLERHRITAVMVDLDDTLVPSGGSVIRQDARDWMAGLVQAGYPLLILSNGERGRVAHWAAEFSIPGFHLAGKPFRFAFRRGLRQLGSAPAQTLMVGDQLFTDVLGANLMGLKSVLVQPLSPGKLPHTRLLRRLERRILRHDPLPGSPDGARARTAGEDPAALEERMDSAGGEHGDSIDR